MAKAPTKGTFTSILDKPASDIKEPPLMPAGSYHFVVHGMPRIDKSTKKQTEFVEFICNYLGALDDVDADALAEAGGFQGKNIKATYYVTEASAFMLKDFLTKALGIEEMDSMRAMIEQAPGKEFIGYIKHEPSQDGQRMFARMGTTTPVGEE